MGQGGAGTPQPVGGKQLRRLTKPSQDLLPNLGDLTTATHLGLARKERQGNMRVSATASATPPATSSATVAVGELPSAARLLNMREGLEAIREELQGNSVASANIDRVIQVYEQATKVGER